MVKQKFNEAAEQEHNDAIRKHYDSRSGNIPLLFWVVLLFFMYEDVFRWIGNPLLLYPLLLIGGFVGLS